MAASGGRLFCATRDNLLCIREPVLQDADWQRTGHADGVVAMTARGADLLCATSDQQIRRRPASADEADWTVVGRAPAPVRALTCVPGDPTVWVATTDGRLWTARP
jgi:hypothetical protein